MTKNIKLGFTKSKAYGLCGIILSTALFSLMAGTVSADEVTAPQPATETVATAATAAPTTETAAPATETAAPVTETPAATEATTKAAEETPTIEKAPTEVSKEGTTITVKNPDVDMHFTKGETGNGTGKYVNFKVEYKDIKFPDSMAINQGDQVVFTMPKEVSFRTNFDFDVKNPANETIGHAQTSIEKGTVTTTFNNYFTEHPLNKEMAMSFDAKWTEAVTSGEVTKPNFDGTVKEVKVDPEAELDPGTEKFSKWGSQAEEDAQVLRWTFRLNLSKQKLENLIVKDRWSSNQEYVDGSLEAFFVDDVKNWTNYTSAKEYLDSFHVLNGGFDLKMKTFDRILYVNYRTRLKTPVKESTDPINAVWATNGSEDPLANNYRAHIALVGGKGQASGEAEEIPTPEPEEPNTPTDPKEETPKETPKEEEKPKETPKETPKEEEKPKETPKETPKEEEKPKETPKETPKDEEKPKEDKPKEDKPKDEEKPKEDKPKDEEKPKEDKPKEDEKPKEDKPKEDEKPKEDKPQPQPEPQPEPQPQPRPVPVPKPDLRRREVPKDEPRKQEVTKEVPTPENKKSENSESKEIKSIGKIVNHRLRSLPKTGTVLSATLSVLGVIGMIIGLKMKRSTEE